ncbi:class I SAM-dependent methyltransferase [Streptomyces albus]|uniref:Class I SAM-dependent methyltransferase n=1 Tax=Streptomyces albus TaxID=1888 RepID=A0A8H1QQG5_9ACTN|nr:class I SAM-dependent methyltransferase [Streptomyces albus]TGG81456.1 class I SAM-dependent methyltransferase [Streptomyces albus]UVN55899.1 methyltransferase domain-containing protein [Streptomyces albus]
MDAEFWDEKYRGHDQLFSGEPNGVLVTEITGLAPGRALDVGCGEGGDALWLARQGWQVTGVDISHVALERAAAAAAAAGVADRVTWMRADPAETPLPAGAFDLVSAHFLPLLRRSGDSAMRGLLDAVAPGGTFLFVFHALDGLPERLEGGFTAADFCHPHDFVPLLGDDWAVVVDETRPRTTPAPAGTHHTHDVVLRARRLR